MSELQLCKLEIDLRVRLFVDKLFVDKLSFFLVCQEPSHLVYLGDFLVDTCSLVLVDKLI